MIFPSWSRGNQGPANEKALITLVMLCLMSEAQQMRVLVETVQCCTEKPRQKMCIQKLHTNVCIFNTVQGLYCKLQTKFFPADLWPTHEGHKSMEKNKICNLLFRPRKPG